jgi:sialidase-1
MAAESEKKLWIHPKTQKLNFDRPGPFSVTGKGVLITVDDRNVLASVDEGETWTSQPLFNYDRNEKEYKISNERVLIRATTGTLILSFMNLNERVWLWRDELHDALPGTRLPQYVVRSTDEGKSWTDVQMLHESWTGEIRNAIETKSGKIIISSMNMLSNPGRHAVLSYVSEDDGVSWKRSNIIDLGGVGHHGGVTEATIEQLTDGRILMYIRTNLGRFWQAYSEDEGLSWREIKPSQVDASSAPGLLKRLSSGNLLLVWNRQFPEGRTEYPLTGGDGLWSQFPVSNHREELAIAFSDDEADNWSDPVIIARHEGSWLSYPRVLERHPGELWLTTMQGALGLRLFETDFT